MLVSPLQSCTEHRLIMTTVSSQRCTSSSLSTSTLPCSTSPSSRESELLYIINPRRACARVIVVVLSVCVCVCVCVSVKSHLASGASVRPENAVTYSVDNIHRSKNLWGFL